MRIPLIFTTVLALMSPMSVLAGTAAKCSCTKKCHAACKKGDNKNCKCKHCDCAKGGTCDQGCSEKKDDAAKTEAPKSE